MNLTNRCTNRCTFCVRNIRPGVGGYHLWLNREPTSWEVITAIDSVSSYQEFVFCGYGEPLIRLQEVLEISTYLKERKGRVRINTNGQANLIHGCQIPPLLAPNIDALSISLNASSQEEYNRLCQPQDPQKAYPSVLDFIQGAKECIKEVTLSAVSHSGVQLKKVEEKALELGLPLRVR